MDTVKNLILVVFILGLTACSSTPKKIDGNDTVVKESQGSITTSGTGSDDITASTKSALDENLEGDVDKLTSEQVFLAHIIYFEYDQSSVPTDYEETLKGHAQKLLDNPNLIIRLEGHADERGTREYNAALAERRGNAVARYLNLLEVPQGNIEVISYGEERPVNEGQSEFFWSENRRVEIQYKER